MIHPHPKIGPAASALVAFAALVAVTVLAPSPAQARPKLGVELRLGLAIPFSRYVRTTLVQLDREVNGTVQTLPYIADATNDGGLAASIGLTFRSVELSLNFFTFPWGQSHLRYQGDKAARVIADQNRLDDAEVRYTALNPNQTTGPIIPSDDLSVVTIDGGYRIYLTEGRIEAYVPVGGGLTLANERNRGENKIGIHVFGGVTTDLNIIRSLTLFFDARYHFLLTEDAVGVNQASQNAVTADENVLSALFSNLHFATFTVGMRYNID